MALEKQEVEAIAKVTAEGAIIVEKVLIIYEDGQELLRRANGREVLMPGDDVSNKSVAVRSVSAQIWTDDVKRKWQEKHPTRPTDVKG